MVRKFDRISIEFSIEFFGRKFYRIFLAGLSCIVTGTWSNGLTTRAYRTNDREVSRGLVILPRHDSAQIVLTRACVANQYNLVLAKLRWPIGGNADLRMERQPLV